MQSMLMASRPGRWRPADPQLQKVQLSSKRNAFRNGASRRKALRLATSRALAIWGR
jgi:hypothetical protein